MAKQFNLDTLFLPPTENLEQHFMSADYLVMPSRWEGFPNVVAEALSFGLPVIAFEKCSGMSQLIVHNVAGVLAHGEMTSHNLSIAIEKACEMTFDPELIQKTTWKYTPELFIESWIVAIS